MECSLYTRYSLSPLCTFIQILNVQEASQTQLVCLKLNLIPNQTSFFLKIYHHGEWQHLSSSCLDPKLHIILTSLFLSYHSHPIHRQILLALFSEYTPNPNSSYALYHCHLIQGTIISCFHYGRLFKQWLQRACKNVSQIVSFLIFKFFIEIQCDIHFGCTDYVFPLLKTSECFSISEQNSKFLL